jgi:hypothetical protein
MLSALTLDALYLLDSARNMLHTLHSLHLLHWTGFVVLHSAPVWAVTAVPMLAVQLGVPQGLDFESNLVFRVGTVVGALSVVALVSFGFVSVLRDELRK